MPKPRKELRIEDLTFLIDSREQTPLVFDSNVKVESLALDTGDYSVQGFEKDEITIERKSLIDLLGCVGNSRERFEREIYRMLGFKSRLVIVEASWDDLMKGEWRSQLHPNHVVGSVIKWMNLGVPFFFHPNRKVLTDFVTRFLFCHVRTFHEKALECHPQFRIEKGS